MSNRSKSSRFFLSILLAAAVVYGGCADETASYPVRQMPEGLMQDAAQLDIGKALFHDKCATCHGKPSEGRSERAAFFQPPAPDFSSTDYLKVDPAYLYWRIEIGKTAEPYRSQGSVMPAWEHHFSETQIWQIVAFLRSRAH